MLMSSEHRKSPCPICESSFVQKTRTLYDDRFGFPGDFDLLSCESCDHSWLEIFPGQLDLTSLYTDFYPRKIFSVENYKAHIEKYGFWAWLDGSASAAYRYVPRGVRVLDIGCGLCEALGYHHARGCEAFGCESDQNVKKVADAFGFKVKIGTFEPGNYEKNFFDYVTLDQVMEHVESPRKTLCGIAQVLKSESGRIVITTPNRGGWGRFLFRRYWIHWHAPYHLHFFSKQSILKAATSAGLSVETAKTVTNSDWLLFQLLHLVTLPKKGMVSKLWSGKGIYSLPQKLIIKFFYLIHQIKILNVITRFFDALGCGDCFVFVLKNADAVQPAQAIPEGVR